VAISLSAAERSGTESFQLNGSQLYHATRVNNMGIFIEIDPSLFCVELFVIFMVDRNTYQPLNSDLQRQHSGPLKSVLFQWILPSNNW
jgi:hypothetical protein